MGASAIARGGGAALGGLGMVTAVMGTAPSPSACAAGGDPRRAMAGGHRLGRRCPPGSGAGLAGGAAWDLGSRRPGWEMGSRNPSRRAGTGGNGAGRAAWVFRSV